MPDYDSNNDVDMATLLRRIQELEARLDDSGRAESAPSPNTSSPSFPPSSNRRKGMMRERRQVTLDDPEDLSTMEREGRDAIMELLNSVDRHY